VLPKITYPTFTVDLPVTKQEVTLRVMTLKEEKLLLTAQEANDTIAMLDCMVQVLTNCLITDIDLSTIPYVEVQYLFLNLRSKSIGSISTINITDEYDNSKKHRIQINIDNVDLNVVAQNNKIFLTDTAGLVMKYPTFKQIRSVQRKKEPIDRTFLYVKESIQFIFDGETVTPVYDIEDQELLDYIENLPSILFEKIQNFIENSPLITYTVEYTNTQGERKKVALDSLENFF